METSHKYKVAGHTFVISLPEGYDRDKYLSPYEPFACDGSDEQPLITLRIALTDNLKEKAEGNVKEIFNDEAPYFWLYEDKANPSEWFFGFSYSKEHPDCILKTSPDYSEGVVYVPARHADRLIEFSLSNAMMLLYTFRTSAHETLLVHASVIEYEGRGYMFLGRSGTGKSTHTALWLKYFGDRARIINGDKPIFRFDGEKMIACGTPWCGKEGFNINADSPVRAVCFLERGETNEICSISPADALMRVFSQILMPKKEQGIDLLFPLLEKMLKTTPCYLLKCNISEEAVRVAYEAMK